MVTLWRVANMVDFETFTSTTLSPDWHTEHLNNEVIDFTINNIESHSATAYDVMFEAPKTNDNSRLVDVAEDDSFSTISNAGSGSVGVASDDVEWDSVLFKTEIASHVAVESIAADAAGVCFVGDRHYCKVCGGAAAGMYFGARVCVPCKV